MAMSIVPYSFAYSPQSIAYLKKLQPKIRGQIVRKIDGLALDKFPPNSRKIQGRSDEGRGVYRIRSGVYRVLYVVREESKQIIILDIGHRKDVYR